MHERRENTLLERLCLVFHGFDTNSLYSSVFYRSGFSNQGSFSGPGSFNSNPVGSSDTEIGGGGTEEGISKPCNSMLSISSGEFLKRGSRECLDLKMEEMVERKRCSAAVASGSASGSGAILMLGFFRNGSEG